MPRPWKPPQRGGWGKGGRKHKGGSAEIARNFARTGQMRAKIVFYALLVLAIFLVGKLYVVQVRDGPLLAAKARDQRLETIALAARRGSILDRDLTPLVRSLPSQSVYATPREVIDKAATAERLGATLGISPARILARLRQSEGGGAVLIARKVEHDPADRVGKLGLPGISVVQEETGVRFLPSGRLASTLLGFTGIDENGLDGVEYAFDRLLRGKPGMNSLETDQFGRAIPFAQQKVVVPARPGYDLALTIDSFLQYNAERVLHETVAKWHAKSGSAIVMNPWTGEILALANVPDYDVRSYAKFTSDSWRDRAVADAYEPGSTFKLITAAAALDSGKVTTADRFPALDKLEVGGRVIHNAEDGFLAGTAGSETLADIIAYSHNVGAAEVGLAIGQRTMYTELRRFGFGDSTHIGLPGENPGIVPPMEDWSASSLPTIAFGHGIAITPIALARAYCAIANGGLLMRPRILSQILRSDGHVVYSYGSQIERRAISAKTARTLRSFLRAVVTHGTGHPTAEVEGYTTAGKTGTAQIPGSGQYVSGQYVASFVGYIPAERPKYVILVKVERPQGAIYGSVIAAPAFAQIARIAMLHSGVMPSPAAVSPRSVKHEAATKKR